MELIEKILAQGTTFRYLRTDTYGEILDLTEEEELAYYHKTHDMTIGGVFLDAFRTKRRNLYKSREQVLEILVEKLLVKTLRGKSVYSNTSPAYRYIREMYGKMVSEGRLVEGCKQTASGKLPLCRTAAGRELKMKRREDDRTECHAVPYRTWPDTSPKTSVNHNFQAGLSIERRTTRLYFNNKR